jgi:ribonucleoside-diphosphate reductase alpha chain
MSTNAEDSMEGYVGPERRKMPVERKSITHKGVIHADDGGDYEFYLTAGMYEDGKLGEIFVRDIGKEGSTIQGLLDAFATMWSIAMQYGAPLDMLSRKFAHMRFPPYGTTDEPDIPYAASLIDYICRWLAARFGSDELLADLQKIAEEMKT